MARLVGRLSHRSTRKTWLVVVALVLVTFLSVPVGWAQHPHVAGPVVHVAPPPRTQPPISYRPAIHAPIYAPRIPIGLATAGAAGFTGFRPPRRPIRPFPPVIAFYVYPFPFSSTWWQWDYCWWEGCGFFGTLGYSSMPLYEYPAVNEVTPSQYEPPVYGEEREDLPELFLKDGSILSVTDYWAVNGELHFTMIEAEGAKPVEHTIPLEQLDLQKSAEVNGRRGFRFMLRDEPFEQYVRDHPDGPPQGSSVPPQ